MQFIDIKTKTDKKRYVDFIYNVYKDNSFFKDTMMSIVNTFLFKKDTFTKQCYIRPVVVIDENEIAAQCMYIYHERLDVLQVGFFEALPNKEDAVEIIIHEAKSECERLGLKKIVIGLNGHVSYGVGLLADNFDVPISFDCLFSQPYYIDYFDKYNFEKQTLTTYYFDVSHTGFKDKVIEKINKNISFRNMNMKNFKEEMFLFGELCNQSLKETHLYFPRDPICMYEMINEMKVFLRPENLIFAVKDGKEIGFIFWHPDYNEIIPGGKKNSILGIGLTYLFNKNKINKMKINAIGILPGYQRTGVTMGLINEVRKNVIGKFPEGETNFVWDNNINSRMLNQHINDREFRHYCVYELNF